MIRVASLLFLCACAAVPDITYVDGGDNCSSNVVPSTYADICCGAVACKGTGCVAACQECESTCTPAELCCPNAQGHAVCKQNLQCAP